MEESLARLSLAFRENIFNLSLGTGLVFGPAMIDLEVHSELISDDDDMMTSGYYTGLAVGVNDHVELAVRYDGFSIDSFSDLEHRIGVGTTLSLKHGIYCALEYSYDKPYEEDGINEIALQVGLESTLKLPGFQRKTLQKK